MLNVINLSKSYGPNLVLSNISFSLEKGARAGLVGANGAGKSTLLKILAGLESRDTGDIFVKPPAATGYLPQYLPGFTGLSIDEFLLQAAGNLKQTETRMHQIEQSMNTLNGNIPANLMDEYGELSTRFQEGGGYEIDHRIDFLMSGLGISYLERSREIDSLSGGEKTRLNLVTVLLQAPGLLLLDEPTNNLDVQSLRWLENYLGGFKGVLVAASHDREFLNNMVNIIFEIDEYTHQLKKYSGNYDAYKTAKQAERKKWEEDYRNQQETINELSRKMKQIGSSTHQMGHKSKSRSKDNDKYIPYYKGQRLQGAVSKPIREAEEQLRRIRENPVPKPPNPLRFKAGFKKQNIKSAEVIRAVSIDKMYGNRTILQDITLSIGYNSRLVITGPNGSGKTTLLRILAGEDSSGIGQIAYSPGIRIGYLSQEPDIVNKETTVLEHFRRGREGLQEESIFELVTCGLFRYEELEKKVRQLSLGQIRKLQIACLIAGEPNILLLDEPTNHLSLDTVEDFEAAIVEFNGPVVAISHDRRFIRRFGGEVLELKEGRLAIMNSHS
jgi:macrolide transport system ATP-binding/permease protein